MLYARIVFGLPVEGPFDYIVPVAFHKKIKIGSRVWVSFGRRRLLGYTVGLASKTHIKNIKPILEVVDDVALLDTKMLLLTKKLSEYYCCSWGEAIETALPEKLRKGRKVTLHLKDTSQARQTGRPEVILLHDLDLGARWGFYFNFIRETLGSGKSVIILLPDIQSLLKIKEKISSVLGVEAIILYRKHASEPEAWARIREGKSSLVLGTRSAVFAPVNNLGLLIVDEEQDSVYKQDQVPHYHAREIAFMRVNIEKKAKLVLGATLPSLEMFYLAKQDKVSYNILPRNKAFPEIRIIDTFHSGTNFTENKALIPKVLTDAIYATLNSKGKILLFLNRKGFATSASCRHCGITLKCPRCNINLTYYFKENMLHCQYCNFKMTPPPHICPNCNSDYIRYRGSGTEKIESEISRLFPQAKIIRLDKQKHIDNNEADIFISTQAIIREDNLDFSLIIILGLDNSLNRIDLRASEKVFSLLAGLLGLTTGKIIIPTRLARNHCLRALLSKNISLFYNEELKYRKTLMFPPYRHLALVKLRSKEEERARISARNLFDKLVKYNKKDKSIEVISVNPGQPAKLRGNFYWQILIRSPGAENISRFLKISLKDFPHSGIIVTVDVDPL